MKASEEKAFNRLIQKLSALRQTLKGEERELLDRIVTTSANEVALHSITPPMEGAVAKKILSTQAIRRTNVDAAARAVSKRAASEVSLHEMDDAAARAVSKKATAKVAIRRTSSKAVAKKGASEIAIHSMNISKANANQPVSMRVSIDETTGEYKVNKT